MLKPLFQLEHFCILLRNKMHSNNFVLKFGFKVKMLVTFENHPNRIRFTQNQVLVTIFIEIPVILMVIMVINCRSHYRSNRSNSWCHRIIHSICNSEIALGINIIHTSESIYHGLLGQINISTPELSTNFHEKCFFENYFVESAVISCEMYWYQMFGPIYSCHGLV